MFDDTLNERQPRIDKLQLAGLFGLMLLGTAFVYSATMVDESASRGALVQPELVQADCVVRAGNGAGGRVLLRGLSHLSRWSFVVYWTGILLLIVVLIPHIRQHARLGGAAVDRPRAVSGPAFRVCQIAFILALAGFLSRPVEELRVPRTSGRPSG